MKILVLNLPNKDRIVRRYMCSYNAPTFLFPPQELLYCATVLKERKGADVTLIDAIAEKMDIKECLKWIGDNNPSILVTMTGIECFESDINALRDIKGQFPALRTVVFGYYPTIFSEEILKNAPVDVILKGEAEESLSGLVLAIEKGGDISKIPGVAFKDGKGIVVHGPEAKRISSLDEVPFPDPSILEYKDYNEMLIPPPVALIQSSRGCPFRCTYCITTYGRQVIMRSPENVVAEIEFLVSRGFKRLRFTDDTFNVDKKRVQRICELIIEKGLDIRWTCLSRVDTIDKEILPIMKKAGCIRIYIGIESFSQKVLDYYMKGYKTVNLQYKLEAVKRSGIESVGFLLIGAPTETEEDFIANKEGLKKAPLDFVIVTKLTPYPGTVLFEKLKDMMDFSLFPYRNIFNRPGKEEEMIRMERELYKVFYFQPGKILFFFRMIFKYPSYVLNTAAQFVKFLVNPNKDKEHPDFL